MSAKTITATSIQDHPMRKNDFTGLRAPGLLAKWPIIGISMFIFGSLLFGALTYNLYAHGPLLAWDKAIANTLPAIGLKSPPFVKDIMVAGFYTGKEVVTVLTILFSLYFLIKKYWQELAMMAIGWIGSALLFNGLSMLRKARLWKVNRKIQLPLLNLRLVPQLWGRIIMKKRSFYWDRL